MSVPATDLGLFAIFIAVLIGPFLWKQIEHNLEAFLLVMGVLAATVAWVWSTGLVLSAILDPILNGIVPAVLIAGIFFHYGRKRIHDYMTKVHGKVPVRFIVFIMIVGLGLLSSIITAIIAALVLIELIGQIPLDRRDKVHVVIVTCFSIGLGAALTPIGEPLSTIAISKLEGKPYFAGFSFLFMNIGLYIITGILLFGLLGVLMVEGKGHRFLKVISLPKEKASRKRKKGPEDRPEPFERVFTRAFKVYIFVAALILLGAGMEVLVDKYFSVLPPMGLYWFNMVSAVLDNATLTAAEVGPALSLMQIKGALMALLVSGGMLIPGNIPNILSARELKIKSREWARVGVPIGMLVMLVFFIWLFLVPVM